MDDGERCYPRIYANDKRLYVVQILTRINGQQPFGLM